MDTTKLSQGALIAAGAGALLLVSTFLPWLGGGGVDLSLWEYESSFDVVVALVALLALVPAIMVMTGSGEGNLPFGLSPGAANALLGTLVAIGILAVLLFGPEGADSKIGLFLGLLAAIGIAYGGFREAQDEVGATATHRDRDRDTGDRL